MAVYQEICTCLKQDIEEQCSVLQVAISINVLVTFSFVYS
jgi:hypothetical protein